MTIRDEIREVIDTYTDDGCLYKDQECESRGRNGWCVSTDASYGCLMRKLDELGVVLMVGGNLDVAECEPLIEDG